MGDKVNPFVTDPTPATPVPDPKQLPASNAVEADIRIRVSSWAIADLRAVLENATKLVESAKDLRPLLEKAGAVAQIVAAFRGKS